MSNSWDINFPKSQVKFKNNNKTMVHSKGICYIPIIAVKGYKTGKHYWEITQSDASNTYIGISFADMDKAWYVGADKSNKVNNKEKD